MWPDKRLTDLFGIQHPIIQAPMLGSSPPDLAAAVSNAGGLGSVPCGEKPADEIRALADETRQKTDKPFNLNFFVRNEAPQVEAPVLERLSSRLAPYYQALDAGEIPADIPSPGTAFGPEIAETVATIKPKVVSFHFGTPSPKAIDILKREGILLISTATTVREAKALEDAGMDAIIAQGWEAGGHRGSHAANGPGDGVGTMALIPQIVDAVSLPVIAAGGIADGRGIAAALALCASGVQIGTAFLSCPEASTDSTRRALLRQAGDEDTMVTDAFSGRPARAVKSRYAREMADMSGQMLPFPLMSALSTPIREACRKSGQDMVSFHLYGQAAALNREHPAQALMQEWIEETRRAIAGLQEPG